MKFLKLIDHSNSFSKGSWAIYLLENNSLRLLKESNHGPWWRNEVKYDIIKTVNHIKIKEISKEEVFLEVL